ncbi:hypothetical protein AB5I41_02035 [Sphingomonas sp. MMS24-JH45]
MQVDELTDSRIMPAGAAMTPDQMAAMSFSYLRNKAQGFDRALWMQFPRTDKQQCMKRQAVMTMMPATPAPATSPTPKGPVELDGVRRRESVTPPAVVRTAPTS